MALGSIATADIDRVMKQVWEAPFPLVGLNYSGMDFGAETDSQPAPILVLDDPQREYRQAIMQYFANAQLTVVTEDGEGAIPQDFWEGLKASLNERMDAAVSTTLFNEPTLEVNEVRQAPVMRTGSRPRPIGDKNAGWFDARVRKNRSKAKAARAARKRNK